ncbi:MAG: hypothetical protein KIG14_00205 [Candidatus Sacchiramonaceae bacterium]|nr:hypothetical protein [Candidatus Saccharimonadaceae bacterium]
MLRDNYLTAGGDEFKDPDGSEYFFVDMIDIGDHYGETDFDFKSADGSTRIYTFWRESKCEGNSVIRVNGTSKVAFLIVLESGGTYCLNN